MTREPRPDWFNDPGLWGRPEADDRTLTLDAIRVRGWQAVLLAARSKRPLARDGHWIVTRDAAAIAQHLDAGGNLGVVAGASTGLAILDPDRMEPWADMIHTLGQPAAAWTLTGRGRLHYFIQWEPDLPAKLEWENGAVLGEIQRGPGQQQIVIPPSIHPDTGKRYEWLVDPVRQPLEPLAGDWRAYLRGCTYAARAAHRRPR